MVRKATNAASTSRLKRPAKGMVKTPAGATVGTAYSANRFAHPFYVSEPASARKPLAGHVRMTDWSKLQLGPIPAVKRNGRIDLSEIIGAAGVKEIIDVGEIRFHSLGDSGVGHADQAENVAEEMATDFKPDAGGLNPAFLFHLGDVIYGPGKDDHYGERFYRPYRHYPGKILAIPGNHDGEAKTPADSPSLKAFVANFCAKAATVPLQASGSGIYRETMTQPGVYWLLEAPFVRIVGLYSNLLENPGYLQGKSSSGQTDLSQLKWLEATLIEISKSKDKKALVIATHHPPYSQSGHSGSTEMSASIDEVCDKVGVWPDLVLSAHAHSYQRYTRRLKAKQVTYIVAGTGGMPPQRVPPANGEPAGNQITYDAAVSSLGYLFITVSPSELKSEFWQLGSDIMKPFDVVKIPL